MEFIIAILLVIVIVMINNMKSSLSEHIVLLEHRISELVRYIDKLKPGETPKQPEVKPDVPPVAPVMEQAPPKVEPVIPEHQIIWEPVPEVEELPKIDDSLAEETVVEEHEPPRPGFFERNPDLEKFVGENLTNKIGIGILVLGIGFFVKYAIDQNWINEIGRVSIGVVTGGILLGIAHRMRQSFAGFSSVLVGGGIAVLYLTIAIAFHEYQLFSQVAAFSIMVGITLFAILFSLGYNRVELAVVAILGGFASPFMVSTGEGNYIVLFTYILILDVGMLVLAYYKKWNIVNIICYVFTALLVGSWLGTRFDPEVRSMVLNALLFNTLFFLVFFVMHVINNIKSGKAFAALDYSLLLSNSFLYYAAGMITLKNPPWDDFRGLFTAGIGAFNFGFAYALYKRDGVDKNLVYLLVGLVLTFISLAAPIQLKGNYITLFWAAEAVVLLWLYQKSGIKLIGFTSIIVTGLMAISMTMDWPQIYGDNVEVMPVILNKGFATGLVSFLSIFITLQLLKKEQQAYTWVPTYRMVLIMGAGLVLYTSLLLELRYQLNVFVDQEEARAVIVGLYNMVFLIGVLIVEKRLTLPDFVRKSMALLGAIGMLSYALYYHRMVVYSRNDFLWDTATSTGIISHYFLLVAVVILSILTLQRVRLMTEFNTSTYNAYAWAFVLFFVFVASAELDHLVVLLGVTNPDDIPRLISQNHKIGYPILWGLSSFGLIAFGLAKKKKHLRLISLTLFLITLLKLFLVDIRGISEGGKIAAFISLGALLLIISFMYQRLKRILLQDDSEKDKTA